MESRRHHVRPRSKKDKSLPYTYEAHVDILEGKGTEPVFDHFFSDTLCGLVECLEDREIQPAHVKLYGLFRGEETLLDNDLCTDDEGRWLKRPTLCHVLEEHYDHTHEGATRDTSKTARACSRTGSAKAPDRPGNRYRISPRFQSVTKCRNETSARNSGSIPPCTSRSPSG